MDGSGINQDSKNNVAMRSWAERWLSVERLSPYVSACGEDIGKALELYEWNIALGQVLMRDISNFEVALRNAYDRVLSEACNGEGHWLRSDESLARRPIIRKARKGELDVNRINRKVIDAVIGRLPSGMPSGSIVANLTLGFWVHLSDRSREAVIWRTALYRAWPKGTKRADLQRSLEGILRVRNRVAHSERLFNPVAPQLSPLAVDTDLFRFFRDLCPEAAEYLYGEVAKTPVEVFCQEHPAPVEVRL